MLASVVALVEEIERGRLLPPAQLAELRGGLRAQFAEPRTLARELVSRGWLTHYQVNELLLGRGASLVLGQYVILERLGEGGMGQVFKARHQALGRVVALKVLRQEQTANLEAIERFRREVQAAAQVSHPNVVLAFDANQVGDTYFLVMEYVDGIDLSRLVKRSGPLPVAEACDYLRQAALGLQHAHERGMVHRDIKPSNLLLTPPPASGVNPEARRRTVKLVDLGVVRMQHPVGEESRTLTQFGTVMGTPDYIAPEQARNAHLADIRSDLYSLGCTFFFLLTGKTPYPGGTLTEKLLRHQLDQPLSIEEVRPGVPPDVVVVLRRLMAKRPQDRYQTPAELATALEGVVKSNPSLTSGINPEALSPAEEPTAVTASAGPPPPGATPPGSERTDSTEIVWASVASTVATGSPSRRAPGRRAGGASPWSGLVPRLWAALQMRRRGPWLAAGAAGVLLGLLLAAIAIALLRRGPASGRHEPPGPPPQPAVYHVHAAANRPWQDTGVDLLVGRPVTIRATGSWRKGRAACSPDGIAGAARDRVVLAQAPLLCLLARVGCEGPPLAVGKERQFVPTRNGRLFVQSNDLDLQDNHGALDLEIEVAAAPAAEGD
jgi:serine/threonine-protein kinase